MLTGGIPPGIASKCSAADAYRRLFRRVITQVFQAPAFKDPELEINSPSPIMTIVQHGV